MAYNIWDAETVLDNIIKDISTWSTHVDIIVNGTTPQLPMSEGLTIALLGSSCNVLIASS